MAKRMLIDALHAEETRVAIADENQIYDFDFVSTAKKQIKGNIYLAKITRVEPSLQAAFVEYGCGKQGFLPFAEIHTDYYQIPFSDRQKLMEEIERELKGEGGEVNEFNENSSNAEDTTETTIEEQIAAEKTVQDATVEEQDSRPAYLVQGEIDLSAEAEDKFVDAILAPIATIVEVEKSPIAEVVSDIPSFNIENSDAPIPSEDMFEEATAPAIAIAQTSGSEEVSEVVETIETAATNSSDDEEIGDKRKRNVFMRRYKIQEVIRRGQVVLVQAIKEERGNKGASLTTYLSLAGRYCVLMPNSPKDGGISRKIASVEDRKRLKAISTEFRLAEGMSVIIRTAGMERTHAEIKRDFDYLVNLWNSIREETLKSNAPALIYEESDIVKRAIRDQYSNDIEEVVIEGGDAYKAARDFMKLLMPSHTAKIKKHDAPTPLFYAYGIEDQLLSMHDPVVKMKSGAYLVINPTEALISIDVNSGRATGERNIEETALKTNLEAAAEVARQLRLRDLAGLVVIDFIDMLESRHRRAVEKMLKDSMKMDRAKIQLGRISPFGLLEMSRQRLRPSISETSMTECPHCAGRGIIRSNESMSIQVIRSIEKEASLGNVVSVRVLASQAITMHMLNYKRDALRDLEKRYDVTIQILINPDLAISEFTIEKIRRGQMQTERAEVSEQPRRPSPPPRKYERPERKPRETVENIAENTGENISEPAENTENSAIEANPRRNRNRRRGRRSGRGNAEIIASDNAINSPSELTTTEGAESGDKKPSEPSERGGRGRRTWRDRGENKTETTNIGVKNNAENAGENDDIPTSWNGGAASITEGKELPAFASDNRPAVIPVPPTYKPFHDYKPEGIEPTEPPPPPAPAKRGWWQKMISLDD
jgi:ribonuclease E